MGCLEALWEFKTRCVFTCTVGRALGLLEVALSRCDCPELAQLRDYLATLKPDLDVMKASEGRLLMDVVEACAARWKSV
jgi:hypothetical protein